MKFLIIIFLLLLSVFIFPQSKQGGICFRVDDNKTIEQFSKYAQKFDKYNKNFCFALNLAGRYFNTQEYIDAVKQFQSNGHELMDHSPTHTTSYFITKFGSDSYKNLQGVDHINGNKICLKYKNKIETKNSVRTGNVNIENNIVTTNSDEFNKFYHGERFIYFPELYSNKIFTIKQINSSDSLIITDAWMDSVNLGKHKNIKYYSFFVSRIHISIDGLNLLANETQKLAELYGLDKPVTWIQPGISSHVAFPYLYRNEIKQSFGKNYNYVSAAVYPGHAEKVFCEYNCNKDKQFAMQWGDFNIDKDSLQKTKTIIADGIAKHCLLIGSSHFNHLLGGWNAYLERIDSILAWCVEKNIPVRTYKEWTDILYNESEDSTENIFPPLFNDFDSNNSPDGYETKKGIWQSNDGVSTSNFYCYSINSKGTFFNVNKLGGIEKGKNTFEFWNKGTIGDSVEIVFKFNKKTLAYKFPAESSEWKHYSIKQLTNKNDLIIPENISKIDLSVNCSDYSSGTVKVSGFRLYKKNKLGKLSVSETNFTVEADTGKINFIISSNVNWSTNKNVNWLTLSTLTGNGNDTVTISFTANEDTLSRKAEVLISGNNIEKQIVITQKGLVTSVNSEIKSLPKKFELFQNYPNPFNPTTTIKYTIPVGAATHESPLQQHVLLKVYNILGKEIATLVNENQKPGIYKVKFNASNLPTGIYFYTLHYGNISKTKKLIILK